MEHLQNYGVVYLDNATLLPEEFAFNYAAWQSRPLSERQELVRALHDADVGEDWEGEDPWPDVSFSPEEISAFSCHILVDVDDGQPEWSRHSIPTNRAGEALSISIPSLINPLSDDTGSE